MNRAIRGGHRLLLAVVAAITVSALASTPARAASATEIDARVQGALEELYASAPEARTLASKASGILVFPRVFKGGWIIGGEWGEGALLVDGQTVQYYRITAAGVGFLFGGQAKKQVLMFMSPEALASFRQGSGWEAGVDGSVAVVQFGAGNQFDTNSTKDPIIAFVYGNKGLMFDVSLEGTKFWKVQK